MKMEATTAVTTKVNIEKIALDASSCCVLGTLNMTSSAKVILVRGSFSVVAILASPDYE